MFIKPDYNLKSIYDIDLAELKTKGINAILFDLDSTLMESKTALYSNSVLEWLSEVKKDFFVGVVSNNNNENYITRVKKVTDFPIVFCAHKPETKVAQAFMKQYGLKPKCTAFVGDRPLTDTLCGKLLGCTTILVDSISADKEKPIVRFVRKLERVVVKK